jgi:hypothetical protein
MVHKTLLDPTQCPPPKNRKLIIIIERERERERENMNKKMQKFIEKEIAP